MKPSKTERPAGVYLITLYFVLSGFLEAIHRYRDWSSTVSWNPFADHSVWYLATDLIVYLILAYLVWRLTWVGRLAALVFGYLYLATRLWLFVLYARGTPMNSGPLFVTLSAYHVLVLPFLLYYMQTQPRKKLFKASLLEILLPHDQDDSDHIGN